MMIKTGWGWFLMILMSFGIGMDSVSADNHCGRCLPGTPSKYETTVFAAVCLINVTDIPIGYEYRWSNSRSWEGNTIYPDDSEIHGIPFTSSQENRPEILIIFDRDRSSYDEIITERLVAYETDRRSCSNK